MPENDHIPLEKHTVTITIKLTYQFIASPLYSKSAYEQILNTLEGGDEVPIYKDRIIHPSVLNFQKIAKEIVQNGIVDLSADLVQIVKTKHKKMSFKIGKKQIKNWSTKK